MAGLPPALLASLGIGVPLDAPNIGRNLSDHRILPVQYRVKRGGSNLGLKGKGLPGAVLRYALLGSGPLAQSTFVAGGFIKTRPDLARPDAQIGLGPFSSGPNGPTRIRPLQSMATACGRRAATSLRSFPRPGGAAAHQRELHGDGI